MTNHWTDRLSEYLDGELSQAEADALEAHLAECAECGNTLQELRAVVARARQLEDRLPERDLWSGIAARIEASDAGVIELPTSRTSRRFSFSGLQLLAASVVLVLMSAGTMYLLTQRQGAPQVVQVPETEAVHPSVRAVTRNYDAAVAELEGVLERNREQLDTATVRVFEQNLAIIDRAIADAQAALGQEPSNPYLTRYLDQTMQKKVQLLRRATRVVRAET